MITINLSSVHPNPWLRQFPNGIPIWGEYRFVFNSESDNYDYLVVFDDLHAPISPTCPMENLIHIATEPPSVQLYNHNFLSQFSWVVTQDTRINHHGIILSQPGLTWFVGWRPGQTEETKTLNFEEIENLFHNQKTKIMSVVASNKSFTAEHAKRLEFALKLKKHYGDDLDFYGRGFVPMDDKLDSLRDYRFQIVLENSSHEHYFSEKLSDCMLSGTFPIYYGCPNLNEYFPEGSYHRINIENFEEAVAIIDKAVADNVDVKCRNALLEGRNKVLYEHNLFAMLARLVTDIENGRYGMPRCGKPLTNDVLPFGHERFSALFNSTPRHGLRIRASKWADKIWLLDRLRRFYRRIR